ncbi:hypothetical protein HD592_002282 [Schaalia hyovaginalis]|uniref:Uncharacterized protein n=1 Tax=Schaalia hyovaginalis TaxID=29316 RepID=A0A923E6M0_9ACTO|nr:hypothetical protein [Schaalia hyovaginalis]
MTTRTLLQAHPLRPGNNSDTTPHSPGPARQQLGHNPTLTRPSPATTRTQPHTHPAQPGNNSDITQGLPAESAGHMDVRGSDAAAMTDLSSQALHDVSDLSPCRPREVFAHPHRDQGHCDRTRPAAPRSGRQHDQRGIATRDAVRGHGTRTPCADSMKGGPRGRTAPRPSSHHAAGTMKGWPSGPALHSIPSTQCESSICSLSGARIVHSSELLFT